MGAKLRVGPGHRKYAWCLGSMRLQEYSALRAKGSGICRYPAILDVFRASKYKACLDFVWWAEIKGGP